MGKPKAAGEKGIEVSIMEVFQGQIEFCVLGTSPLIYNALSAKTQQYLLMPPQKKNAVEKATTMKHQPFEEYRNSVYSSNDSKSAALLSFPSSAFKGAVASTALDLPGTTKTQIERLVWALGDRVEIFGKPKILCAIVRSADMARTPDVRTRAILPEWACRVRFQFLKPNLTEKGISQLLATAGMIRGVGDWRQEKGSGSYGQFKIVSPDDPDFVRICVEQGREVQAAGLADPEYYNDETGRLLSWFVEESAKRKDAPAVVAEGSNGRSKKASKEKDTPTA